MTTIDEFVLELKAFFKDAMPFLKETCEEYSMSGDDDNKRDALVSGIEKLEKMMTSLSGSGGSKRFVPPPVSEEIYDDTVEPNNNDKDTEEEYLDAESAIRPRQPEQGIMEETYEETGEELPEDGGQMDDMYEDPYADGRRQSPPKDAGSQENEQQPITDDYYEDPYADGKRKEPPPPPPPKSNEKTKNHKKSKKNKDKDKHEGDNKSESSSEESSIKKIPAAELADAFHGVLKKHKAKDSWYKFTRWCAVQDYIMYYYESAKSKAQKGAIPLQSYEASAVYEEVKKKKYVFQLACPGKKTYYFTTNEEDEMKKWIKYLNKGELELDSEDETYELEDPQQGDNKKAKPEESSKEESGDGIMEETYENPDDYVRSGNIQKPAITQHEPELPPPPRKDIGARTPPPPTPRREVQVPPATPSRRPVVPSPPPGGDDDGELYDDAESALPDDELYTDGTSAAAEESAEQHSRPVPPPIAPPISTRSKQPLLPPINKPTIELPDVRISLPPPPEDVINFEAMFYGLWSCQGVGDDELEFNKGECIEIVDKSKFEKDGWWVGKLGIKVGLVPKSYLAPMYKAV